MQRVARNKGRQESASARSKTAHEHSKMVHRMSQTQKLNASRFGCDAALDSRDSHGREHRMTHDSPYTRNVPDAIDEAVRSVTQLHSDHHGRTTAPQRAVNRITAFMARPLFAAVVGLSVVGWIGANLIASAVGLQAIDAPAFPWLQGVANLFSLCVVMLVLVAQKHEDELNAHRDTLTLELAILGEHKIAKVIQLLEELRRDSPHVQDRVDRQADQMAQPADAGSVLAATRANSAP
jgi:uncharacterized membrane protein